MKSLNKIIEIMDFVENYDEQKSENDLIDEFGRKDFRLFSRYCLGGHEPYAIDNQSKFKLTQIGVRRLHELKKIQEEEKRNNYVVAATIVIAIFTVVQVIGLFIN